MPINNGGNNNQYDGSYIWNDYESEQILKSNLRGNATVAPQNDATLVTVTVGPEPFYLLGFRASSQGDSLYQLILNGEVIASRRTMAGVLDCEVHFPGKKKLKNTDVLILKVTNNFTYDTINVEGEIYAQ